MKAILHISSHVAAGSVGNRAGVFALERLGFEVWSVPTVVFSHTPGPKGFAGEEIAPALLEMLLAKIEARGAAHALAAVHSGYFRSAAQIEIVASLFRRLKAAAPELIVSVDPVLGNEDKGLYVAPAVAETMRKDLVPLADMLHPNVFELGFLTGMAITGSSAALKAAEKLSAGEIVMTSIPAHALSEIETLIRSATAAVRVKTPRLAIGPHGTGDLLSALYLGRRCLGEAPAKALSLAVSSVYGFVLRAQSGGQDDIPLARNQELILRPERLFPADFIN